MKKLQRHELSWIDDFWKKAGGHIFAREEDGVLILPPTRVYRVNPTGARLVSYLKRGGKARHLKLPTDEAARETALFFGDLAALYRGEAALNGTVGVVPYDFNFTRWPVLAEFALTYRCNNRCLFCYAGCNQGAVEAASRRPELGTADCKKIIDIFASTARVPFFSFTGGEPLLREDLESLVRHAGKRGLVTNLVTNGTLATPARAKALAKAGLGSVQVSVEAPEAHLHDGLVGRAGAFTQALTGIAAFRSASIPTQTNTTLTALNVSIAPAMPAFLKALGIGRFAMNLYIPGCASGAAGAEAERNARRLFLPYSSVPPVVRSVREASVQEGLTFYWYSPTPFCHFNPIAEGLGNKSCAAADGLLSVAPDGEVLPCSSWDEGLGNLLTSDFASIWLSPEASFFKEKRFAPDSCSSCADFTACQGACPLYWRFAGTGELEKRTAPAGLAEGASLAKSASSREAP